MKIQDVQAGVDLRPMKLSVHETPHSTIEPTRECNIECRSCYNLDRGHEKTLDQVKEEIDLACQKRNLQAITLLGGEPTLHPDIAEIIRYVKGKRLICQILTNGIALLDDEDGGFLDSLLAAGVDKILLHMDTGQSHVHRDIDQARRALFDKLEANRVHFSLSVTVYNECGSKIPGLVKEYSRYRYFDGILAVLARDPKPPHLQNAEMADEYRSISGELGIEPTAYIPSNLSDSDVSWLMYFYYINADNGRTFGLSPRLDRAFRGLYRRLTGRHLFVIRFPSLSFLPALMLAGLLEVAVRPRRLSDLLGLLGGSRMARSIRFHYIVIQNPPEFDEERQELQLCYNCPDATIRNGMLTPVCVADQVNPLGKNTKALKVDEDLYLAVYGHLGELRERRNPEQPP